MMKMRVLTVALILAWTASLALPVGMDVYEYDGGPIDPRAVDRVFGFVYLILGWLGPLAIDCNGYDLPGYEHWPCWAIDGLPLAAFGWYANVFWVWNIARMSAGKAPLAVPALFSAALGLIALQPVHFTIGDDHGVISMNVPLIGAFLWAVAMATPLLVLSAARLARLF